MAVHLANWSGSVELFRLLRTESDFAPVHPFAMRKNRPQRDLRKDSGLRWQEIVEKLAEERGFQEKTDAVRRHLASGPDSAAKRVVLRNVRAPQAYGDERRRSKSKRT